MFLCLSEIPFETRTKFGTPVFHSKSKKEPLVPFLGTSSAQLGPARHVGQRCRRCHRCCCCCCCRPAAGPILRLKFWRKKISTTFFSEKNSFFIISVGSSRMLRSSKKKVGKTASASSFSSSSSFSRSWSFPAKENKNFITVLNAPPVAAAESGAGTESAPLRKCPERQKDVWLRYLVAICL